MGKLDRRSFLEELIATQIEEKPLAGEDQLFKKYANKATPNSVNKTTGASLSQYTGPWTEKEVIHLLRRTGFGVKYSDVQTYKAMTMSQAVDTILNLSTPLPAPPVNNYNTGTYTDPTGITLGQTWVNAAYGDGTVNSKRNFSLKSWWTSLMINQDATIREKMVLFWHNYFATEISNIGDARFAYKHNALLRSNALGNFKTLTRQVTTDPAMLKYLNGYLNTKTAPDENYGRELQELFTVSKDTSPTYLEDDVKAAAHVLTGWRVNTTTISSLFDSTKHDTTDKQFSAFYSNTKIKGQTGAAGAAETDALIDMLFNKQETATHFCRRLYRFFVYYAIDSNIEYNIILLLAQALQLNSFEVKPVLALLLKSDHFYSTDSQGCYIRPPLDFLVGTFRTFNVSITSGLTIDNEYKIWYYVRNYGSVLGQDLGDPPNVAGWPAYHQEPEFHEVWINSTTLPSRMQFTDMMLNSGFTGGSGSTTKIDIINFAKQFPNAGDPNVLMDCFISMLLGINVLSTTTKTTLKISTLLSGQITDTYWTAAWTTYLGNPNTTNTNTVKTRLTALALELVRMAEHHLC